MEWIVGVDEVVDDIGMDVSHCLYAKMLCCGITTNSAILEMYIIESKRK